MTAADDTSGRLARIEEHMQQISARLAALEQAAVKPAAFEAGHWPAGVPAGVPAEPRGVPAGLAVPAAPGGPDSGEAGFIISGQVQLGGSRFMIRQRVPLSAALDTDPDAAAKVFAALASPARLTVLRALLDGPRTSQQLRAELDDASVGQLYHHLRELLAAGLIIQPARSQYAIPRGALVMLCVQLTAAARLGANISLPIPPDEEPPAAGSGQGNTEPELLGWNLHGLSQRFHGRNRREQGLGRFRRQPAQAFRQHLGPMRPDPVVDLLPGRGHLYPGGPHVARVRQPPHQAALVEDLDDPRQHRGVDPFEVGQLRQAERTAEADQREHRVLRRGEALAGRRVVELAGKPADHSAKPGHQFVIHHIHRSNLNACQQATSLAGL